MNETIRSLQREHEEKFARANELLSKAEPTAAEQTEGVALIEAIKDVKSRIEQQFKLLDARGQLQSLSADGIDPGIKEFLHRGRIGHDGGFAVPGFTPAGKCVIDSFGTALDEAGPGSFSEKRWQAIQTKDYRQGFNKYIRAKGSFRGLQGLELKVLQEGLDDQGGVSVPADVLQRIVMRKPAPTQLSGLVTTLTTGRDRVVMPRVQYSADDLFVTNFRVTWTGEIPSSATAAAVNDQNLLGNLEIPVFTAMMTCPITNDMIEDNAFPIQQWIEDQLRLTVDLTVEQMIVLGTGKGQPTGYLVNPGGPNQPAAVLSGVAGGLNGDSIIAAAYSIPPQYDDELRFVFNKTQTALAISQLKDANGRYLFGSGYQDSGIASARPKELVGYPYVYSQFMPGIGAANYPVLCGDLRGYYRVQRLGITIQVLREVAAQLNQIILVARVRFGGQVAEPWRMKLLKSNNA